MSLPKRSMESEVDLDSVKLVWRLHREQQWCTADRWKGVSIQVSAVDGKHRELLLEYPTVKNQKTYYRRATWSTRLRIHPKRVEAHMRMAISAGWEPSSRGKPFVHQVAELPN